MIKQLLIVLVVIIAIVCIRAATRPDTFRVERSITIKAPPANIFGLINDFHNFGKWSPWEHLDPNMERSITGAPTGKGAVYQWSGNSKAGAGRMEILESTPSSRVLMSLDFLKPIKSSSQAEYTLTPQGDSTKVTWAMYGPSPFVSKIMQVFVTMDKLIGGDFEKGLAAMKTEAEKA
ncbi:MAG: SRPBCC family protein [Gemmatimonadaceae bacterium]|nr:SRPBCC family protein [Gemmatimonadaceae bacterium]